MPLDASLPTGASVLTAAEGDDNDGPPGGVSSVTSGDEDLVFNPTTGAVVGTQTIKATWTLPVSNAVPNYRYYALDGVNGLDTNTGWATTPAAAGLVAVKTAARLNAILPISGAGRNVAILIGAGTYAEFASFLVGRFGYNYFVCRGTVTDATSGSVAFSDSTIDRITCGGVTATGMNAAGYNPAGVPTTRSIPCLKVGGAAPGFPAEVPISLPGGARLRFDAATATVALRNFVTTVVRVSGGNTLEVAKVCPAVPTAADIFYLEMPGVIFTHVAAQFSQADTTTASIAGLQTNGTVSGARGFFFGAWKGTMGFCWNTGTGLMAANAGNVSFNSAYNITGAFVDTGGACRANGAISGTGMNSFTVAVGISPYCTNFVVSRSGGSELPSAFVCTAGVTWDLIADAPPVNETDPNCIGTLTRTEVGVRASRIIGPGSTNSAGLYLGSDAFLGSIEFSGMGANPCIKVATMGGRYYIDGPLANGPDGGNTDVGLDLTLASGCTFYLNSQPTVTGTAGDVRLAGGQIVTWASLFTSGLVDSKGNRFISACCPLVATRFAGTVSGGAGAVLTYLSDGDPAAANQTTALRTPSSQRLAMRLRVTCISTTSVNTVTVTLYKNAAPTSMQVSIPSGTAAYAKFVDAAHPIYFADGDDYDLRMDDPAGDGGDHTTISGSLEWAA